MGRVDHLFVVGAGFSRHAGLPLTTEFSERLLSTQKFGERAPSTMMANFLREFVAQTFDHKVTVAAKYWPELEDIFTCVDLSANTGHHLGPKYSPSQLRTVRRALIVRTIRMLRQASAEGKGGRTSGRQNFQTFFDQLDKESSAFLSMNWDSVIEEGLEKASGIGADYMCDALAAKFEKESIRLVSQSKKAMPVLKPHGSTNWLYCDACRQLFSFAPSSTLRIAQQLFTDRDWDVVQQFVHDRPKSSSVKPMSCPVCRAAALGTRFATFSYRKALDFPMHARSWLSAEKLLREAATWIFIGYSLPAADYEFKHLLKRVERSRVNKPSLMLVTGGAGADQTRVNYQKFFGPHFKVGGGTYFSDGIDSAVLKELRNIGALKMERRTVPVP